MFVLLFYFLIIILSYCQGVISVGLITPRSPYPLTTSVIFSIFIDCFVYAIMCHSL